MNKKHGGGTAHVAPCAANQSDDSSQYNLHSALLNTSFLWVIRSSYHSYSWNSLKARQIFRTLTIPITCENEVGMLLSLSTALAAIAQVLPSSFGKLWEADKCALAKVCLVWMNAVRRGPYNQPVVWPHARPRPNRRVRPRRLRQSQPSVSQWS